MSQKHCEEESIYKLTHTVSIWNCKGSILTRKAATWCSIHFSPNPYKILFPSKTIDQLKSSRKGSTETPALHSIGSLLLLHYSSPCAPLPWLHHGIVEPRGRCQLPLPRLPLRTSFHSTDHLLLLLLDRLSLPPLLLADSIASNALRVQSSVPEYFNDGQHQKIETCAAITGSGGLGRGWSEVGIGNGAQRWSLWCSNSHWKKALYRIEIVSKNL